MATAFTSTTGNAVDIRDVLTCVICGDERSSPFIQLNCFHLCHTCCLGNSRPGSQISCAKCKATTLVPEKGTEGLSDELLQYKMREIAAIYSNTSPPCKLCEFTDEINASTHFCITCKNYLCPSDTKRHKAFPDHKVITNDEVQTDQYLSQILTSKDAVCSIHSTASATEIIKFYCEECKIPACQVCCITDHKPHKTISIQQASHRIKEELKTKSKDIIPMKKICEMTVYKLEKLLDDIETESKQQIAQCKKWGEDVKQTVDKIVNKNVQNLEKMTKIQKDEIEKKKKEKNDQNHQFQGGRDYMEVFIKFGSDSDFMKQYTKFMENLNNSLQQNTNVQITNRKTKVERKDVKEIERCMEEMLKVKTVNETFQISTPPQQHTHHQRQQQQQQQIKSCVLESKWKVTFKSGLAIDGEDIIAVGEKNIAVYGMNGQVKGQITCQELGEAWDVEVVNKQILVSDETKGKVLVIEKNGKIVRTISLHTQDGGLHKRLCLAVDHTHTNIYIGSEETNTVYKCSIGEAQAHPFITTGLNKPAYICMTVNNELIVTNERSHTVSKYNSNGIQIWVYGKVGAGVSELNRPVGVCVDPWGYVFVCDTYNNRIHHLSPEGKFMSFLDIGEMIRYPQAITFSNQKIIVSNAYSGALNLWVIGCNYN